MERGEEPGHALGRDLQEIDAFADDAGLEHGCRVKVLDKREILGPSDEELDGGEVVGIECESGQDFRHGDETFPPSRGQCIEDRITEDAHAPFEERRGVDAAKCQPALNVVERDEQIGGMRRGLPGDALPTAGTILPAEVVIGAG